MEGSLQMRGRGPKRGVVVGSLEEVGWSLEEMEGVYCRGGGGGS